MSCVLDDITFDNTPTWPDRNKYEDVTTEASFAIDGSEITVNGARGDQYPITLECTRETGWQKGTTVTNLRAKSATVNSYWTLTLNSTAYKVRFRNEQSGGAVQMEPLLTSTAPDSNTYYIGKIYLMRVG